MEIPLAFNYRGIPKGFIRHRKITSFRQSQYGCEHSVFLALTMVTSNIALFINV